jgi:selenocysteine lyase/cysteine desulfurase
MLGTKEEINQFVEAIKKIKQTLRL